MKLFTLSFYFPHNCVLVQNVNSMADDKLRYTNSQINLFLANLTDHTERKIKKDLLAYFEQTQNLGGFIAWFMHPKINASCDKIIMYVSSDWGVMVIRQRYLHVLQKFNIFVEKKHN